jgi:hypothetical protein
MGFLTFSLNVTLDGCVDAAPQRRSRDALPARLATGCSGRSAARPPLNPSIRRQTEIAVASIRRASVLPAL